MNYDEALKKLEHLRKLIEQYMPQQYQSTPEHEALSRQICEVYGEVEEIILRMEGRGTVVVPPLRGGMQPAAYPNFIEAGFLSGFGIHTHQGYAQLLKIIGKVRRMAAAPALPRDEASIGGLLQTLGRFRECCQYVRQPPAGERDVQDIVWIMLRSRFDRVDREDTLPKFGAKNYKPDFGVPELATLIEVKFIGEKTNIADIQEEILADVPGYLGEHSIYKSLVVLVYDGTHKLRDPRKFIDDLRSVEGIVDVLVVPGIG
jgi:hypothetical protein